MSRSNVHLILTNLGNNVLAVRNAVGKVQILRFSKGVLCYIARSCNEFLFGSTSCLL